MFAKTLAREQSALITFFMRVSDVLLYIGCGMWAFYAQFYSFSLPLRYQLALLWGILLLLSTFSLLGVYQSFRERKNVDYFRASIIAIVILMLLLAASAFITKTGEYYSRAWFLMWHLYAAVAFILLRIVLFYFIRIACKHGMNYKRIVVIGSGKLAEELANAIKHVLWSGFAIVAIFDVQHSHSLYPPSSDINGMEIQQLPEDISNYVQENKIDEVWLVLSLWKREEIKNLMEKFQRNVVTLRYFPDVTGLNLLHHEVSEVLGFPVINIIASPMTGMNRLVKAIEDRVLAFLILILISPIMFLIALLVKASSPGPILYRQLRHGWDGKPIKVYKFRTMHVHDEPKGIVTQAAANDNRITKIGSILRRTSLDELPQFINVLQGRMSIVGPRPHAVEHNEHYKNLIKSYMLRHHVKPGITGWAQICGWRGETDTLDKMQKRVEHDLFYINHWSLWFDLKIVLLTIVKGFVNKNAY